MEALKETVGCDKTYVMLFAEQARYQHVHVHVVPRMSWFCQDDIATAVFRFLNVSEDEQVSAAERDRLAGEIGRAIRTGLLV